MFEFRFNSFSEFLAMGDYGVYVWPSYLAFVVWVAWNFVQPKLERKRIVRLLRARQGKPLQQAGAAVLPEQQGAQQQQGPASRG